MEPVTPPCESVNLGEICVEPLPSCANSPVVPILKRAFGGVSLDAAACGPAGLTVGEERFAREPLLVAWSLVACWAALGLPSAMAPLVAAAPSFLLLPLLSSELKPTSTNAPETNSHQLLGKWQSPEKVLVTLMMGAAKGIIKVVKKRGPLISLSAEGAFREGTVSSVPALGYLTGI